MSQAQAPATGADQPRFESDTTIRLGVSGPKAFVERTAWIAGMEQPLVYGVREPWHAVYGTTPERFPTRPTTNDVFIASVGACMTGTLGGMLEARGINLSRENCTVAVHGEIGAPDAGKGGHIVRSVDVAIRLTGFDDPAQRATIDRVHPLVHGECWLSQTLAGSRCQITLSVQYDPADGGRAGSAGAGPG